MIEDLLRRMKKTLEFHTAETHPLVETENFMLEIDAELAKLNTMSVAELVDRVKRGEKWAVVHKPDQAVEKPLVELAREAKVLIRGHYDETGSTPQELERFAELVRADERLKAETVKGQWVGLTDEEIIAMRHLRDWTAGWTDITYARAIETKLKEKNT